MFKVLSRCLTKAARQGIVSLAFCAVAALVPVGIYSQGATSNIGNGGIHNIQGRIYTADGRRGGVSGLVVRLKSTAGADITVFTDNAGTFMFRGLAAGSYTVQVDGTEAFETASEPVYLDEVGSSVFYNGPPIRPTPQTANVQIFLKPAARPGSADQTGVINVKWSAVPKKALDQYDHALRLIRDGRDNDAEAELKKVVEAAPSFAPAYTALGRIAQRAGRLNDAIALWNKAVQYDDKDFDAHLNLGIAYLNLHELAKSESELVAAALIDRRAIAPHYNLGLLFVVKNDLAVAQKAFETARELDTANSLPAIHKYLGRVYSVNDMPKNAVKELEMYLSLVPQATDAAKVRQDIADIKSKKR